jgi:hypothetical protein
MEDEAITRREFLRSLGRWAGLLALGGLAGAVSWKSATASASAGEQPCRNEGWCRPCPLNRDCGLPRALSYRSVAGKEP